MALPTYDKTKRRKSYPQLPKAAYVCRLIGAKLLQTKDKAGEYLEIGFDIAEGDYAGFYDKQYQSMDADTKKWPNDALFRLNVPREGSPEYVWANYNTFFADLEDSNGGFVFNGDLKTLKDKLIGGKFHIEQSEYKGTVYDHTRFRFSCVADDVRNGKAGKLPNDKLISGKGTKASGLADTGFMTIPDDAAEELPF